MNYTIQNYDDSKQKEPILKIWREINARENSDETSQSLEESESSQNEQVN